MDTRTSLLLAALALGAGCLGQPGFDPDAQDDSEALTRSPLTDQVPWAVAVSSGTTSCSATVLSSHWILLAAHCLKAFPTPDVDVSLGLLPSSPGGPAPMLHLYNGAAHYFIHPDYHTTHIGDLYLDSDADDDIGLIRLEKPTGINLSRTGQAKLFADAREPYHGTWADRTFSIVGYGKGTDVGGSSDCDDGLAHGKRLARDKYTVNVSGDNYQAHAPFGSAHPCPGDSGGPWLFERGASGAREFMQFAIMSTVRPDTWVTSPKMWGALVPPRKAWIESTSASGPHRLTCGAHTTGGWRYLRCDEPLIVAPIDPAVVEVGLSR